MFNREGRFLRVDLSTGRCQVEAIPENILRDFVGGRGLGIRYLYKELKPGADPLGPENKLLFTVGPLAGTSAQGFARWIVVTKSPLTGSYARASAGADFGAWLGFSGFDFILVEGKADRPVYLHLEQDRPELLDAGHLWGKDTEQTQELLQQAHGPNTRAACIGPAGENLVRYAAIVSARRTASRCGVGTVMGSKSLKAIAISARRRVSLHDPAAFKEEVLRQVKLLQESPRRQRMTTYGTSWATETHHNMGLFPVRNFQEGTFSGIENLSTEAFSGIKVGQFGCFSCMVRCGQIRQVASGPYAGSQSEGPEYETIWAFSGQTGVTDIGAVVAADALCDLMGLDTLSMGNSIGFAMELYQRGILTSQDCDGMELTWGNHVAMLELIRKVARREGIGNLLAEGVKRAAERLGKGAADYAMQVKGLELPAYEPRGAKAQGLSMATSNLGGNHNYGYARQEIAGTTEPRAVDRFADEGKGDITAWNQITKAVQEVAIQCNFAQTGAVVIPEMKMIGRLLAAATGDSKLADLAYLEKVGERIVCLERAFNVREGFSRKDDSLPKRMLQEPLPNAGPATGQVVRKLDTLLDEYYTAIGFDPHGIPTAERLKELGLDFAIEEVRAASGSS